MPQIPPRRPDIRLILLLGALAACGPLATDMYLPSLPSIAQAFAVATGAAQSTLTSFMLGFSVGMLLYGPLSDAYGRRPVLLGGIAMFVLASVACCLSYSIGSLVLFRFVQALGAGAASVLSRAIARDAHEPADAARVLSMVSIVMAIGPLLAPLVGGQLLLLGGWRTVFAALTLFGAACAVLAWSRIPETWPPEKRRHAALLQSFAVYGRLLRDPLVWGHVLCGGMAFAAMFAYITATPFVYIEYFHVSPQHYGLLFGLNVAGIIAGNYLNARLVLRRGALPVIAFASALGCAASLVVALVCVTGLGGLWAIVAALFFVVAVVGVLLANCTTELMHRYPHNAGAAAALFGAMQLAFGALASFAVGLWEGVSPTGMGVTIGVSGGLCFVGRAMVLRWQRRAVPGVAA